MTTGNKVLPTATALVALLSGINSYANTLTVTDIDPHAAGGLLTMLELARPGDTIVFDSQLPFYELSLSDDLIIDKAITIDAKALLFGLEINKRLSSRGHIIINTQGDDKPFHLRNAVFENFFAIDSSYITLEDSDFICYECYFINNEVSSSTGHGGIINSQGGDLALINSYFFANLADNSLIYHGTGSVALVNSVFIGNSSLLQNDTALFRGIGNNQHFLVRNSTIVGNFNTAFKLETSVSSTSKLSLGHSIIAAYPGLGTVDIDANFYSTGYNLLGDVASQVQSKIQPSDTIGVNLLDVFEERPESTNNRIDSGDVLIRPDLDFRGFYIQLREDGLAHNQGNPNFKASNIFFESAGFSDAIRLQLLQAIQNGDQFGDIHPRIADGRIDIGAYEQD